MAVSCGKLLAVSLALLAVGFVAVDAQLRCVACSTENDLNCLFRPDTLAPIVCPPVGDVAPGLFNSACITRQINATHLRRGCAAHEAVPCQNGDPTCAQCTNDAGTAANLGASNIACNRLTQLPTTRRSCVQCEGTLNSVCATEQNADRSASCLNLGERCFTRVSDRMVIRGCQDQHRGLCDDQAQCLFCNANGCNVLAHNHTTIPRATNSANGLATVGPMVVLGAVAMLWNQVWA